MLLTTLRHFFFHQHFLRFHTDALWKGPHFWLGKITLHGSWFICLSRWQMAKHKHKKREPWSSNENACHNKETTKRTFLTFPGKFLLCSMNARGGKRNIKSFSFSFLQNYAICFVSKWAQSILKMLNAGFIVLQQSTKSLFIYCFDLNTLLTTLK